MQKNMGAIGTGWFWLTFFMVTLPIFSIFVVLDCIGLIYESIGEFGSDVRRAAQKIGGWFIGAMPRLDKHDRI